MKLRVKTLKGTHFEIQVQPSDTIIAVKKNIEEVQGKESYPWGQQLLIHSGKVLKDESTLEENNVRENGFLVVMLSKSKSSGTAGASSGQPSATPVVRQPTAPEALPQAPEPNPLPVSERPNAQVPADAYGQAASNVVAGSNLDQTINQLMEMGGGNWDQETVLQALRAAYNNPERAVEYLYSGIPVTADVAVPATSFPSSQASGQVANSSETASAGVPTLSGVPNSSPLNMFPQESPSMGASAGVGSLDFLRHNRQFLALRSMVQANPQILQPMLQELSKQNPQLLRLIQEHHAEFLQLINEPLEDIEAELFNQPVPPGLHPPITITSEEEAMIERLQAMGFERGRVLQAFLLCDRNEQLAANYLLEHAGDIDED